MQAATEHGEMETSKLIFIHSGKEGTRLERLVSWMSLSEGKSYFGRKPLLS
ncbi:LOW QUALITY PROTEIN: hypothetical protein PanWU01x14_129190 [Parasponia andersonii]|uniref:Uncharacterized protein n=1 Tax=Parasponia andersonii TaxID=3476 RepID=A0A2P5CRU9_PARAD|nr:LOW QUALITY PROTEIN: hypothetical protein PanWU01x14_129190 [Parasponia andersonii]